MKGRAIAGVTLDDLDGPVAMKLEDRDLRARHSNRASSALATGITSLDPDQAAAAGLVEDHTLAGEHPGVADFDHVAMVWRGEAAYSRGISRRAGPRLGHRPAALTRATQQRETPDHQDVAQ